jgi:cell division protein FtsZ
MSLNLKLPDIRELKPRITVFGVGGAGGNAVNNMIQSGLNGVEFVVANTDAQALTLSRAERIIQMGVAVTEGLGAGSQPEVGRAAAEEVIDEIADHLDGSHMVFITAGMGGGTGTGSAPVIAKAARDRGILTVGVVTKPFHFEGQRRMRIAETGISELQASVDTLIVIPNQNLFRIANERTTFADAFAMADQVLYSGVACITDLMVKEGLINLDFADVRSIMRGMGKAMMGTGEASGDKRAMQAAEAAIANPLLDETSMKGAKGLLISITGGKDMTLFEVDEAATRIREEVDPDANIIMGATFDDALEGMIRVSVVATGIDQIAGYQAPPIETRVAEAERRRAMAAPARAPQAEPARYEAPRAEPARMEAPAPRFEARPAAEPAPIAPIVSRAEREARIEAEIAIPEPVAAPVNVTPVMAAPVMVAEDPSIRIERVEAPAKAFETRIPDPIAEMDAPMMARPEPAPVTKPYIPPAAERPVEPRLGAQRMPRVDEFPPIVQRQMASPPAAAEDVPAEDRRPMGLLRRLATGFGRHHDEPEAPMAAPAPQRAHPPAPQAPVMRERPVARPPEAPRGVEGRLDPMGRPAPQPRVAEDDQMDIPAFLRRQAN